MLFRNDRQAVLNKTKGGHVSVLKPLGPTSDIDQNHKIKTRWPNAVLLGYNLIKNGRNEKVGKPKSSS